MSWSEVKKINSDLSTPLNELITKPTQLKTFGYKASSPTTLTTILNAQGKGSLFYFWANFSNIAKQNTLRLQVIIDDETVMDVLLKNDSTSSSGYLTYYHELLTNLYADTSNNLAAENRHLYIADVALAGSLTPPAVTLPTIDTTYILPLYEPITMSYPYNNSHMYKCISLADKPLLFNRSLVVRLAGSNAVNTQISAVYKLNEEAA